MATLLRNKFRKPLSRINLSKTNSNENINVTNITDYFPIKNPTNLIKKNNFSKPLPVKRNNIKTKSKTVSKKSSSNKLNKTSLSNQKIEQLIPISKYPLVINSEPQYVNEYLNDILMYYTQLNGQVELIYGYMNYQPEINDKIRAFLVEWIVGVHMQFKLNEETLFLCVNIIDKVLSKVSVKRTQLQLLAITSLFISEKYEEIYPPELKEHVGKTGLGYTCKDIISMEYYILKYLNFELSFPTSLRYFEIYYHKLKNYTNSKEIKEEFIFGRYLLELCLVDYHMLAYSNAEIAIVSCFISDRVKGNWCLENLGKIANDFIFDEIKLKSCAKKICEILENIETSPFNAVYNKYMSQEFLQVANWKNTMNETNFIDNSSITK